MSVKNKICNGVTMLSRAIRSKEMIPIIQYVDKENILSGKIALITGGSGGIGLAIAKTFLNSGAKVIITGTNEEKLERCERQLDNSNVRGVVLDLLNINNIDDTIEKIEKLFPENRIDILVNAAGQMSKLPFSQTTEDEYDNVMDVNMKGTYFISQKVSNTMISKGIKGHILNISSSSAERPAWNPYQISKWAIKGFTKGLADVLYPYGIIVNAIAPGPTATAMLGVKEGDSIQNQEGIAGRYALPDEIAQLAVYMVSDCANLVVGDTFYITGGSGIISMHK